MKATTIVKISPLIEMSSPILLRCRSGECGGCPNNTGKLLWVPKKNSSDVTFTETFNFQYKFFNKASASTSNIKYNVVDGNTTVNGNTPSYSERPDKAWAIANKAVEPDITLSPFLMEARIEDNLPSIDCPFNFQGNGGWIFFRQPNPAINNVHDALCFEYIHEKKLIIFRSF